MACQNLTFIRQIGFNLSRKHIKFVILILILIIIIITQTTISIKVKLSLTRHRVRDALISRLATRRR